MNEIKIELKSIEDKNIAKSFFLCKENLILAYIYREITDEIINAIAIVNSEKVEDLKKFISEDKNKTDSIIYNSETQQYFFRVTAYNPLHLKEDFVCLLKPLSFIKRNDLNFFYLKAIALPCNLKYLSEFTKRASNNILCHIKEAIKVFDKFKDISAYLVIENIRLLVNNDEIFEDLKKTLKLKIVSENEIHFEAYHKDYKEIRTHKMKLNPFSVNICTDLSRFTPETFIISSYFQTLENKKMR